MELTLDHYGHVFRIRTNNGEGSCFIYGCEKGTVFVSAKHCFEGSMPGENILIYKDTEWKPFEITNIALDNSGNDVCAFTLNMRVTTNLITKWGGNSFFGDKNLFFGYPLGLQCDTDINGFPIPLCRIAFFSGVVEMEGNHVVILDGINNKGYSGGPVFQAKEPFNLKGVVSGYRYDRVIPVLKKNEENDDIDTGQFVKPNSGMIYVTPVKSAIDLINDLDRWNPV